MTRRRPGQVRDAIVRVLEHSPRGAAVGEVCEQVSQLVGEVVPPSSVRSYLRLNTPELFVRTDRGQYTLAGFDTDAPVVKTVGPAAVTESRFGRSLLVQSDCIEWLRQQPRQSIHAVVTDPPYGLVEYNEVEWAEVTTHGSDTQRARSVDTLSSPPAPSSMAGAL